MDTRPKKEQGASGPVFRSLDFTDDDEDLGLPKSLQNSPGNDDLIFVRT
jgi:hypothetical protein